MFLTTRTRNSELWFVNNPLLTETVLGYLANCAERYGVTLYGFAIEGNHHQLPAKFSEGHQSDFMRDFNSMSAKAVIRLTDHPGGGVYYRRYSSEWLPGAEDIENWFFYTALQPVQDGLVERIGQFPGYNFFHDAVWGIEREFEVFDRAGFNAEKRYNPQVRRVDYVKIVKLKYQRLPGYEHLSQKEYALLMHQKLEVRRQEIVRQRLKAGLGFMGPERLKKVRPGSRPLNTKTSTRYSHRPRVLSICDERRNDEKDRYFQTYRDYKEASKRFRSGELYVVFPEGTFRPSMRYFASNPPTASPPAISQ